MATERHEIVALSSTSAEDAVLRPVRGTNAFEDVVERILHAIKLGIVPFGERLPPERELASKLGVSRVTLREAISALHESGYVESRRGRTGGTFVTYRPRATPKRDTAVRRMVQSMGTSLDDALTFRAALEPGAAAAAAERELTAEDREMLRARLDESDAASLAEYRQADSRLHLAIAQVTGSPSLAAAVADVRMRLNDLLDAIPLLAANIEHSRRQHIAIVDAILDGRIDRARREMQDHLDGTAALLRGFLG